MQKRNKFERVQLPRKFGLNGENSVLITSMHDLEIREFVRRRKVFSVRTFWPDGLTPNITAPHLPTITKRALFKKAPELFRAQLLLIVADQIDPKDCEFRGCIHINHFGDAIMEIAIGPGTVRTVTNEGKIDERLNYPKGCELNLEQHHDYCIEQCLKTGLKSVIFEFSFYNIPIGWKQSQFICWEITDDGTKMNRLFKE